MRLRTYIVDAFVVGGQPGTGNAAGVVLLPSIVRDPVQSSTSNADDDDAEAAALALDDAARQRLAAELRQTETAFVERRRGKRQDDGRGDDTFLLRWFTPTTEVPLCGHATLAAAAALVAEGVGGCEEGGGGGGGGGGGAGGEDREAAATAVYRFETVSSGLLTVRVRFPPASSPAAAPTFELDLPSRPPTDPPPRGFRMPPRQDAEAAENPPSGCPTPATTALLRALCRGGGSGSGSGDDDEPSPVLLLLQRLRGISFNAELGYLVVELEPGGGKEGNSAAAELIGGLTPDPRALREAVSLAEGTSGSGSGSGGGGGGGKSPSSVSGVLVASLDDAEGGPAVLVSRFFAPWMGIDEDPVTGSAHAVLAPLWDGELRRRRRRRREGGRGAGDVADVTGNGDDGRLFWRARQLSARGGELSVCFQEDRKRVLVAGGAAVALEGWAHV